ncbi:hypothetical protein [Nocardia arizonensis]|nr:hypothetical protein [Nocardia arizonensis]
MHDLVAATARVSGRAIPVRHRGAVAEARRIGGDTASAARELG